MGRGAGCFMRQTRFGGAVELVGGYRHPMNLGQQEQEGFSVISADRAPTTE